VTCSGVRSSALARWLARLDDTMAKAAAGLACRRVGGAEAQLRLLRAGTPAEALRAAEAKIAALRSTESMWESACEGRWLKPESLRRIERAGTAEASAEERTAAATATASSRLAASRAGVTASRYH
jgi:hypothetical protein